MQKIFNSFFILAAGMLLVAALGCNKYLNEPLPSGNILQSNAFVSDNSVSAVVTGNLMNFVNEGFLSNGYYAMGLYVDETEYVNPGNLATAPALVYLDGVQTGNTSVNFWTSSYNQIYDVNAALAGIQSAGSSLAFGNQWLGESYFTRAVVYFYLTNLYGAVPLALTTDYATNNVLSRASQSAVYQQIVADLGQARNLLNYGYTSAYGSPTSDRVRPDRYVATAMLAKVYLYTQKWDSAEAMADSVIANTSTYALAPLASVFSANGKETIWTIEPPVGKPATQDYLNYNGGMPTPVPVGKTFGYYNVYGLMDTALVNTFESGDGRLASWVRVDSIAGSPGTTGWFPNKYSALSTTAQLPIVLRMGELYLLRAEARAMQGNIAGAQADLNAVRARAGLAATTASDQASLLAAIMHERRVELFTEGGNRFFDLKRWGIIDSVMTAFAPTKSSTSKWSDYMQLLPLPTNDLQQDANLTQNPGYAE